jgi:hypothetical protein
MTGYQPDPRKPGRSFLPALVVVLLYAPVSYAKPPTLTDLFPPGGARGRTVDVKVSGTFDHWPVKAWVEGRGVEFRAAKEKGKLEAVVAADARPGLYWVRLYDEEGATALRPFIVGTLPEIVEIEPNDELRAAQRLGKTATTVNGRLARAGDVDAFIIDLTRGQTLVADLEAGRHLGSPMDAVLQVVSPDGSVLAQNDDDIGRDPRIVFEAPSSGPYIVRVFGFPATPDSGIRFAGDNTFVYRLTLTSAGFIDYAFPLAVGRDGPGSVEAIGWNILADSRVMPIPEKDGRDVFAMSHTALTGVVDVRRVSFSATVETEPNDSGRPQTITNPVALSGRIDPPGDQDTFRLSLRKGDKRVFRIESRALGRPLDPTLRVLDSGSKILADVDDTGRNNRDLERSFIAPADGDYRLLVRDLNGRGGPRFAYLLSVLEPGPDFTLSLTTDRFDVMPGKPTKVVVAIQRKDGFAEPIELVAEDLPAGMTSRPIISKAGEPSGRSVTLELMAGEGASSGPVRIIGRSMKDPQTSHAAMAPVAGFEAKTEWPWMTILSHDPVRR